MEELWQAVKHADGTAAAPRKHGNGDPSPR
jgi:hypothetical protein